MSSYECEIKRLNKLIDAEYERKKPFNENYKSNLDKINSIKKERLENINLIKKESLENINSIKKDNKELIKLIRKGNKGLYKLISQRNYSTDQRDIIKLKKENYDLRFTLAHLENEK